MPGWAYNNKHYFLSLLQADGKYELERFPDAVGDAGDLFRAGYRNEIGPSFLG